ncbi:hypothetical protein ACFFU9_02940 [Mariniflexile ostreae]|uniref:DUF4412 domain-containing protein n=1 Tax=Mariniflexile ostreae TaxID=1520892 RepID=A0ABV5F8A8_9FLAO
MKVKYVLFIICVLFIGTHSEAQFFKKLKEKAEEAAERTILRKTDEGVSKKTEKTIDDITKESQNEKSGSSTEGSINKPAVSLFGGLENLPDSYTFEYVMDMEMTTHKDHMNLQYYIAPSASYFGSTVPNDDTNNIMVYDIENQAMVTFIDNNGQKMAMKMRIPLDDELQKMMDKTDDKEDRSQKHQHFIPLPNKTILGYDCKGYQVEQDEGISKIYMTTEAPVSFLGMFASLNTVKNSMKATEVPFDKNALLMEMEFVSNKGKRDNMHMICTGIKKQSLSIHKADYKSGF